MTNTKFENEVKRLTIIHQCRVGLALNESKDKSIIPKIKVTKEHAWYICYVYSLVGVCPKVKAKAKEAIEQYRNKYTHHTLNFVKDIGNIHGVQFICLWVK